MHRDIKPENILLKSNGMVKLADFGTAYKFRDITKTKTFAGTLWFMCPEMMAGKAYDLSADIWSLGITAIELAEGRPPNSNLRPAEAMWTLLGKQVLPMPPAHASSHTSYPPLQTNLRQRSRTRASGRRISGTSCAARCGRTPRIGRRRRSCCGILSS